MPRALLVNPWIYDFSAFDLWAQPLGLLNLAAILRLGGWEVELLDCTDRLRAGESPDPFHVGRYEAVEVPKPPALAKLPRRYKRYGVSPDDVRSDLASREIPDVILVTSRMTYWYPGVAEAIAECRRAFPGVPVVLGGIYATLCRDHAHAVCRPDRLFAGDAEPVIGEIVEQASRKPFGMSRQEVAHMAEFANLPFPAYDLISRKGALAIETSRGCPFQCSYCSTPLLNPRVRRKPPAKVVDGIERAVLEFGTTDFAFYDDALLAMPDRHFLAIAREFRARGLRARFHAPNSLFASMIDDVVAQEMMAMGFETIRISLESASEMRLREWNRRHVNPTHFAAAMRALRAAGFSRRQLGVYILCGGPGQSVAEVRDSIDAVVDNGGTPRLAEYSPIPGTPEFRKAMADSGLPLEAEPLLHNNSVYYWMSGNLTPQELSGLKHYARTRMDQVAASHESRVHDLQ